MTVSGGRYELGARIGSGAAADVYRAHDHELGRDVALKLLRPAFADDPELARRFAREADTVRAIEHPNVVRVLDRGVLDGQPYLAMEYIEGQTLQHLIRARGRLSEDAARDIGAQIAAALDAAHRRGVIHRDLKPANVLVGANGVVKVSDFGIAHLDAATQLTRTGEVLGTPRYVAPEQVEGRIDSRTDIYALGIVLYEMVTGRAPFDGESAVEIVTKQLRSRPTPPRTIVRGLSPDLERTIMRALEKDPARRFATVEELRRALERPVASAVPAYASRAKRARPSRGATVGRAVATLATTLLAVIALTNVAFAKWADLAAFSGLASAPRAVASAPPTATVAAVQPTVRPTVTPPPTPTASPRPTPSATPTVAPTPRPTPTEARTFGLADPRSTLSSFYALVNGKRYDDAAALWSARMRASYPPATNIYGRFDATSSITLRGASLSSLSDTSAVVSVDILEVLKDGTARVWVGQWTLARAGTSWLMDSPSLRRA